MLSFFQIQNQSGVRAGLVLLSFCSLIVLFSGCRTQSDEKYSPPHPALTLAQFQKYEATHQTLILDVRAPEEFQAGHVPGALNLPLADFVNNYERIRSRLDHYKRELVVVYCSSRWCEASDEAQSRLVALGFKHVGRFPGGWQEWREAGLPVETGLTQK